MLLDTSVFRDYIRGVPGARAIIEQLIAGAITASVSHMTIFELWGRAGFDRRSEIGYVGLLRYLEEAPLSVEAAKVAGLWIGSVEEGKREGLARFAIIAAIARERGESICTAEPEPFRRFYSETVGY